MKTYKVVEIIEVEDQIVNTIVIEEGIKELKKAKRIADRDCEDFYDNPWRCHDRDDGLEVYHRWKVYDEETNEVVYEVY